MWTATILVLTAAGAASWHALAFRSALRPGRRLALEIAAAVCWLAAATVLGFDVVARYAALAESPPAGHDAWMAAYLAVPLRCAAWGTVFGAAVALRIAKAAGIDHLRAGRWMSGLAVLLLLALFGGGGCTGGFLLGDALR